MRLIYYTGLIVLLCSLSSALASEFTSDVPTEIPVKGMVTMVAIGSEHCLPCRTVAPILKQLKEEYTGRAAIICIDSGKETKLTNKFNVRVTPTLILFDKNGKETKRHEGVLDKQGIVAILNEEGVK